MNEEKMLRICLAGSILGLLALYFIATNLAAVHVKIGEVSGNLMGSVVKVDGEVGDFYEHSSGHLFFNLMDESGRIRVVVWSDMAEELGLTGFNVSGIRDGARLEITGTVEMYRGELELIPLRSQIKILD
jgi:exonuclease VII large subunit